jgi:ribosome biogenesis GTPase
MAPKFRGDSEDWLDEESEDRASSRPAAASRSRSAADQARAEPLPPEQANATVAEVFPNRCRVRMDDGSEFLCSYRRATLFRHGQEFRERSPVAVGDRVKVSSDSPQAGVVEGLCQRRNSLIRPAPHQENVRHVIAANIDDLVIVTSAGEPVFTPGLVDRYLVAAEAEKIQPLICLNKIDMGLSSEASHSIGLYAGLGYGIYQVSAKKGLGMSEFGHRLAGRSVVYCGQSGVGKTSLLRALLGTEVGRVGELSAATGKGRHTTTGAVLLHGPGQGHWIDTPGIREFGLARVEAGNLSGCFPEFRALACPMSGCRHLDEPGCLARELPRYPSYRRILESLMAGEG